MSEFTPAEYQEIAIEFLRERPKAALWLAPGMRKTSSTLTVMLELMDSVDVDRWLVVTTPRLATKGWPAEVKKWRKFRQLRLRVLTAEDLPTERVEVVRRGHPVKISRLIDPRGQRYRIMRERADVFTISADLLPRLVKLFGDDWPFKGVVLDESSLFKNHDSDRFKAMRAVRQKTAYLYELTGTPAPNGLEQLWSQIFLLDGGQRLGRTITEFRQRFMEPDKRNRDRVFSYRPRAGARERIYELVSDLCLSMASEDWQELPTCVVEPLQVYLDDRSLSVYRQLERDFLLPYRDTVITAETAGALRGKLRQMANGIVYDEDGTAIDVHTAKLDTLAELIETSDGPMLIAYEFSHDRERLRDRFPQLVLLEEREDFEEAWNRGEIALGGMHPRQGGHGLNLQESGLGAVWYGPVDDLELWIQFNKRMHRSGRKEPVFIYVLVAQGTVDEDVVANTGEKDIDQNRLLEATKRRIARLA